MVGGKGTRLRPLTDTRPKPTLPVMDRPCLSYLLESLARGGIEKVILACGYRPEEMAAAIGDGSREGLEIEYAYEDTPMGTAGAIKLLEKDLDEVFVAANGDVFADMDLRKEIEEHERTKASLTISLTRVRDPSEFGIARLDGTGRILEFREKPKTKEEQFSDLANAGVYVVNKDVLRYVPEGKMYDFSKDLTIDLINKGYRVQGHILDGMWMDVGRPKDLIGANIAAAERAGRRDHGDAVRGSEITGTFHLGQGSRMTDSAVSGSVISKECVISSSNISGSLIMSGCDITGAEISGSIIGERCTIGEGVRVLDAVIADDTVMTSKKDKGKAVR